MDATEPTDLFPRLRALADRADALRERCPYRFLHMTPGEVDGFLDRQFIPRVLGWPPRDVGRLEPLLGLGVSEAYLAYLSVLGGLHHQLFCGDERMDTPEAYARLRQEALYDNLNWNGAEHLPPFREMLSRGVFLNQLGGFAAWYLIGGQRTQALVKAWSEGTRDGEGAFRTEAPLLECLEARMTHFEGRVSQALEFGGSLVARGRELPVGRTLGPALVEYPHDTWRVELTEEEVRRVDARWPFLERGTP